MRTLAQPRSSQMCAVLVLAGVMILAGPATAAYNQGNNQQGQYQEQGNQSQQRGPMRNMQIEQQLASQLRNEGYGEQGQIMILALGDKVVLLGTVPSNAKKSGAADLAKSIPGVKNVDNRLHVMKEGKQVSDAQLKKDVTNNLPDNLRKTTQVQAQNGVVTLSGQAQNWNQVADAINAAFAAGAQEVNSHFSVAGARGYFPSYGYMPGQGGAAGAQAQATAADLQLSLRVAQQLRQQLPPQQNVELIRPQNIYVAASNGTVTLHGYVQSLRQKMQATQAAQSVRGVRNINNDLTILSTQGGPAQPGAQGEQGGYYPPQGYTPGPQYQSQQGMGGQGQWGQGGYNQQQGSMPGPQGSGATAGQGQYGATGGPGGPGAAGPQTVMSDRRLARSIQQQLQNQFPNANINVMASEGTVTLQGTVANSAEKQQAERFAYSIPGVQHVQNNLMVSGQGGTTGQPGMGGQQGYGGMGGQQGYGSMGGQQGFGGTAGQQATMSQADLALAQQVAQKLQQVSGIRNVQVMRPDTIYVSARQGTVVLEGFVQNPNVTQQATQIARAIPGVRNVQSMLKITTGAGGFHPSYGYVPGQGQQGQMGQQGQESQGFEGQPGAGTAGQNAGGAQFSQTAYGQSETGEDTGTEPMGGQYGAAPSLPPIGMSPSDTALAWQVAQQLQQRLPNQWVQVVRPDTIYVVANQGTIMLYGFVTDPSVKQHASQVAQSVSGVQHVSNSLGIAGAGAAPALGYIPGRENQPENQQFGTEQSNIGGYSSEEYDNQ